MINLAVICFYAIIASFSRIHAIGLWFTLLITHGIIYYFFGEDSAHLPLIVGLTVIFLIIIRRQWSGIPLKILMLPLGLIFTMVVAAAFGINLGISVTTLMLYARGFILVLLLAGCIKSEGDLKIMAIYCIIGLLIGALFTIYQYELGATYMYGQKMHSPSLRQASLRGDPNDTAMLLLTGVPLIFYWYFKSINVFHKFITIVSMIILVTGIVLTGSRGGFVAFILVMAIIFIKKPNVSVFIAGILLLAGLMAVAPSIYWERMNTLIQMKEEKGSASLYRRAALQKNGLIILFNHPVLGVGPGNFGEALGQSMQTVGGMSFSAKTSGTVAHNMYLEFFAENGTVGGALFLVILLQSLLNLLKYDRIISQNKNSFGIGLAFALALCGMMFAGLFLSQAKNSVLWFVVGIGIAAGLMTPRGQSSEQRIDDMSINRVKL